MSSAKKIKDLFGRFDDNDFGRDYLLVPNNVPYPEGTVDIAACPLDAREIIEEAIYEMVTEDPAAKTKSWAVYELVEFVTIELCEDDDIKIVFTEDELEDELEAEDDLDE